LEEVLELHRKNDPVEGLLSSAERHLQERGFDRAKRDFEQALSLKTNSARAHSGLAKIHFEWNQAAEALKHVEQAIASNPNYLEPYRIKLKWAQSEKQFPVVIALARLLHERSPENPKYTMILAKTCLEQGDMQASELYFKMTISVSPKLAAAYKGLGEVYFKQGNYPRSRRYFMKALDLDGDDISVLNGLGTASVRQGLFKEGINYYLMALKLDNRNPKVKFNLGHAYEKLGDADQAVRYFRAALVDDPNFEKAKTALERALAAKSDLAS
jgi:tetratricopeptide (TPR) repeat protein